MDHYLMIKMALQNIGAGNMMPVMITKIENHTTKIVNMGDVAKALARPALYITKYFGYELGTESKFDKKTGVSLVKGSHNTTKLSGLLEKFIEKYVLCYACRNPETEILITKTTWSSKLQLKCAACDFVSDVDMRHMMGSYIVEKYYKDKKKAKMRAEKQRLKEDEAADKVMKKLTTDVKKTKDGHGKTIRSKKKGNGPDEDHVSPTVSQAGDKDDSEGLIDTSAEPVLQTIQERFDILKLTTCSAVSENVKKSQGLIRE